MTNDETSLEESCRLAGIRPDLFADVTLYTSEQGGKATAILGLWYGCPCEIEGAKWAWDCRIALGHLPLRPGETRRVGIAFLSGEEAAMAIRAAGRFVLWEGRPIGEGVVVSSLCPSKFLANPL